jgi:membrane protein
VRVRLPVPLSLFVEAIKGWSRDEVPRLGASLAYYTLLSLAPMLLIVIAVAGTVFGRDAVQGELVAQIQGLIGERGAVAVQELLAGAWRERAGVLAIVIGSIAFLFAALGAFIELQHALNKIFRVKAKVRLARKPGRFLLEFLEDRVKSFGMILAIGFLLLVSLALSAALAAASDWMAARVPALAGVWLAADAVLALGAITVLFALIYRFLPDVRLSWRDVWIGGLTTALLFTVGKQLIGLYLGRSAVASTYGAAGSVVVLLVWVYYSSQVILLGAEFTRVWYERNNGREPVPKPYAREAPEAHPGAATAAGSRK